MPRGLHLTNAVSYEWGRCRRAAGKLIFHQHWQLLLDRLNIVEKINEKDFFSKRMWVIFGRL
jgi:hypothetical protein